MGWGCWFFGGWVDDFWFVLWCVLFVWIGWFDGCWIVVGFCFGFGFGLGGWCVCYVFYLDCIGFVGRYCYGMLVEVGCVVFCIVLVLLGFGCCCYCCVGVCVVVWSVGVDCGWGVLFGNLWWWWGVMFLDLGLDFYVRGNIGWNLVVLSDIFFVLLD